jgi:predicted nuclease with TOPRIM domain
MLVPVDYETSKAENPALSPAHEEDNFARTEERLTHMNDELASTKKDIHEGLAHVKEELVSTKKAINNGLTSVQEGLAHIKKEFAQRKEELVCMNKDITRMEEGVAQMNEDIARGRRILDSLLTAHLVPDLLHCVRLFSYHFAAEYEKQPRDLATTPSIAKVAEQASKHPMSLVGIAFAVFTNSPDFACF